MHLLGAGVLLGCAPGLEGLGLCAPPTAPLWITRPEGQEGLWKSRNVPSTSRYAGGTFLGLLLAFVGHPMGRGNLATPKVPRVSGEGPPARRGGGGGSWLVMVWLVMVWLGHRFRIADLMRGACGAHRFRIAGRMPPALGRFARRLAPGLGFSDVGLGFGPADKLPCVVHHGDELGPLKGIEKVRVGAAPASCSAQVEALPTLQAPAWCLDGNTRLKGKPGQNAFSAQFML